MWLGWWGGCYVGRHPSSNQHNSLCLEWYRALIEFRMGNMIWIWTWNWTLIINICFPNVRIKIEFCSCILKHCDNLFSINWNVNFLDFRKKKQYDFPPTVIFYECRVAVFVYLRYNLNTPLYLHVMMVDVVSRDTEHVTLSYTSNVFVRGYQPAITVQLFRPDKGALVTQHHRFITCAIVIRYDTFNLFCVFFCVL